MMDVIIEQLKNLAEDFDQNEKRFTELSERRYRSTFCMQSLPEWSEA
ncbi:MAG: hypothetical protein ACLTI1_08380 [Clostridia bacterium]